MQCAETLRVQAYFDQEVDAVSAADIERHIGRCGECRALIDDLERMRTAVRRDLPRETASDELRARVARALDAEEAAAGTPRSNGKVTSVWRRKPFWAGALTGVGASSIAAALSFLLLSAAFTNSLLDQLVAAHSRSLLSAHLIDVESSDHHTVKPWFAGHADVSPIVADFTPLGYQLVGGRADFIDHQRSAVVVYRHGRHVINVFSWAADGRRATTRNTTRHGYHLALWQAGDLEYCAVSDTGWDELQGLVRLLQQASALDRRE